jgi:hypothetical protein
MSFLDGHEIANEIGQTMLVVECRFGDTLTVPS